jgi:hypothetical protein
MGQIKIIKNLFANAILDMVVKIDHLTGNQTLATPTVGKYATN